MKITLLCGNLNFGGVQRAVLTLADGLAKKDDLTIDLAALRGRGEFVSLHATSVNVVDLNCTRQALALLFPFSRLTKYFQKAKPDVVISFGHSINCLVALAKLLRRLPFRLIVSEHNSFDARMAPDAKCHRWRRWRRIIRARFLYRQAELCVCVSRGVADELVGLKVIPQEKTRVIHNAVDGLRLAMQTQDPVPHPWLQSRNIPVIMSVGRLAPVKGLDALIRAFALLRYEMRFDARLMIVGKGWDRKRLEALARLLEIDQDVCFVGYVPNPGAYMARASLVVLSSYYEGFASVLAEALACGVNVVSTDCKSGPREILEDGKWGKLVPVGDIEALAAAMRDALSAPLPPEDLKKHAASFSVELLIDAYYNVIRRVARKRRRAVQ
ncbi:MAG: glycosyltransferase [Synergistaceae bacterium]|jgi:glycosyltransferase involved in cell wall biosynthesis|nr:glycosyltransferase [Synergistaceae bacterium]